MHNKVDIIANGIKVAINLSPMEEDTKESINWGIDSATLIHNAQQNEELKYIREMACHYNLDRVIAFTGTILGKQQTALKLYGGDMSAFCRALGLTLFMDNNLPAELAYIDRMVQQNGIVIYERK